MSQVDFYTMLSGLGDSIAAQRKEAARKELLSGAVGPDGGVDFGKAILGATRTGDIETAGKIAAIQKSIAPESSAELQAYKFAQAQGYKGSLLDFAKAKAEAGATKVTTNTNVQSGEKEFDKTVGKGYGERFLETQKAGAGATGAIANLRKLESLVDDPNFYSGTGGETATAVKRGLVSLGIKDADTAAPNELFQKIASKSVLDAAGGSLGAGFSNADRSFLEQTVPNIGNTPAGNRQIIAVGLAVEKRKQDVAKLMREYASKNGGRIDSGFDGILADYAEKNPLFAGMKPPTAAAPQPRGAAPTQADYEAEARRRGLIK